MAKKRKNKKKFRISDLLIILVFLIGVMILGYPTISDLWNEYRNSKTIINYNQTISKLDDSQYEKIWAEARAYNAQHTSNTIVDAFNEEENDYVLSHPYDQILNPLGNEIMGYIEIPKINVKLAIYHGIGTEALENGCGHIEGTSLPIGGADTHTVLSAHRGLPSAKLFTDLDQLEEGDIFLIRVLDEVLAYKVDQIKTVLPSETEDLAIEEGRDLATLVTCTPYGVNTHRLLVRGERTEYVEEMEENNNVILRNPLEKTDRRQTLLIVGLGIFILFMLLLNIVFEIRDRRRKKKQRNEEKMKEGSEEKENSEE